MNPRLWEYSGEILKKDNNNNSCRYKLKKNVWLFYITLFIIDDIVMNNIVVTCIAYTNILDDMYIYTRMFIALPI